MAGIPTSQPQIVQTTKFGAPAPIGLSFDAKQVALERAQKIQTMLDELRAQFQNAGVTTISEETLFKEAAMLVDREERKVNPELQAAKLNKSLSSLPKFMGGPEVEQYFYQLELHFPSNLPDYNKLELLKKLLIGDALVQSSSWQCSTYMQMKGMLIAHYALSEPEIICRLEKVVYEGDVRQYNAKFNKILAGNKTLALYNRMQLNTLYCKPLPRALINALIANMATKTLDELQTVAIESYQSFRQILGAAAEEGANSHISAAELKLLQHPSMSLSSSGASVQTQASPFSAVQNLPGGNQTPQNAVQGPSNPSGAPPRQPFARGTNYQPAPSPGDPNAPFFGRCDNCGVVGHRAKDCQQPFNVEKQKEAQERRNAAIAARQAPQTKDTAVFQYGFEQPDGQYYGGTYIEGSRLPTAQEVRRQAQSANSEQQCAFLERTIKDAIAVDVSGPQGDVSKALVRGMGAIFALIKHHHTGTQTKETRVQHADEIEQVLEGVKVQQTFSARLRNEPSFRADVFELTYRMLLEGGDESRAQQIIRDVQQQVQKRRAVERAVLDELSPVDSHMDEVGVQSTIQESSIAQQAASAGRRGAGITGIQMRGLNNLEASGDVVDYTAGIKPDSSHHLLRVKVNDAALVHGIRDNGADDTIVGRDVVPMLNCKAMANNERQFQALGKNAGGRFLGMLERVKLDFGNGLVVHHNIHVVDDDKMIFLLGNDLFNKYLLNTLHQSDAEQIMLVKNMADGVTGLIKYETCATPP